MRLKNHELELLRVCAKQLDSILNGTFSVTDWFSIAENLHSASKIARRIFEQLSLED